MTFQGDQDDWDKTPSTYKDHLTRSFLHAAGLGEHPGKYQGPKHEIRYDQDRNVHEYPTESDLAHQRFEEGLPAPPMPPGPVPPQETISQPQPGGGKKQGKPGKPPAGTTPAGLGEKAVEPPTPQGEY